MRAKAGPCPYQKFKFSELGRSQVLTFSIDKGITPRSRLEMARVGDGLTFNRLGAEGGSHRDGDAHKAQVRDGHSGSEALVAVMQAGDLRNRNHLTRPHHRSRLGAVFGK
jgi:hypothetical protein